jgi:hypothetical protein
MEHEVLDLLDESLGGGVAYPPGSSDVLQTDVLRCLDKGGGARSQVRIARGGFRIVGGPAGKIVHQSLPKSSKGFDLRRRPE